MMLNVKPMRSMPWCWDGDIRSFGERYDFIEGTREFIQMRAELRERFLKFEGDPSSFEFKKGSKSTAESNA